MADQREPPTSQSQVHLHPGEKGLARSDVLVVQAIPSGATQEQQKSRCAAASVECTAACSPQPSFVPYILLYFVHTAPSTGSSLDNGPTAYTLCTYTRKWSSLFSSPIIHTYHWHLVLHPFPAQPSVRRLPQPPNACRVKGARLVELLHVIRQPRSVKHRACAHQQQLHSTGPHKTAHLPLARLPGFSSQLQLLLAAVPPVTAHCLCAPSRLLIVLV